MIVTGIKKKYQTLISEERSKKVLFNVLSSFFVKFFSMAVTLTLIPVSLKFTDKSTYGVWLTLASVITWINLFDFGLSNGLTNKLSQAFALKQQEKARIYLSTTYGFLTLIVTGFSIIFYTSSNFINWSSVFNTTMANEEMRLAINITFASFSVTFVLKPLNDLLKANQQHFLLSIIQVCGNTIALICIYFFGSYFESKFLFLCITLSLSYPLSLLIASIILYSTSFRFIIPQTTLIRRSVLRDIFGVSGKFFIIQISVIAILTSNNFLISYFVDNQSVTYYNIGFRLFSIISIFQIMIMTPLWPAFTDAYTVKDMQWIKNTVSRSNKLNFLLCVPLILMFFLCGQIYNVWIGPDVQIPFEVNALLAIFVGVSLFKETYVSFINGVGKLNIQTIYSVVTIILQIPLAYFLTEVCKLGIAGILYLNIFWVTVALILYKIQYGVIIVNQDSKRIWN